VDHVSKSQVDLHLDLRLSESSNEPDPCALVVVTLFDPLGTERIRIELKSVVRDGSRADLSQPRNHEVEIVRAEGQEVDIPGWPRG
jgi:hypothetical protein